MARPPNVRSIISARGVRVAVALLLMGVGVWAFAPYVAYRVSSSAFVNSEISRVRAPTRDIFQTSSHARASSSIWLRR